MPIVKLNEGGNEYSMYMWKQEKLGQTQRYYRFSI